MFHLALWIGCAVITLIALIVWGEYTYNLIRYGPERADEVEERRRTGFFSDRAVYNLWLASLPSVFLGFVLVSGNYDKGDNGLVILIAALIVSACLFSVTGRRGLHPAT